MQTETVSTDAIVKGDTVLIDGVAVTIGHNDIKGNSFSGVTICGRPFIETKRTVSRVLFPKWFKGEIIRFQSQI